MTFRPCLVCGQPSPQSRCPAHRTKDTRRRTGPGEASHDQIWRKLSTQARRASPFCVDCGAVEGLTTDHLLPKVDYPELVHAIENVAVRCRSCNSRRGTKFAEADAQAVLDRLTASHTRRPTKQGAERIAAAQRALRTRGEAPDPAHHMPPGEAKFESLSPAGRPAVAGSGASKP